MADAYVLAKMFAEMAVLLELKGENTFKIRAYENAARALKELSADLAELAAQGRLQGIKGIGKTMTQHIKEYIETGRVTYYEELRGQVPPVLFELVKIPGLGPKKALLLHEQLGINSVGELEYACRENRLKTLSGFGEKSQEKILAGIDFLKKYQGRFLLGDAWPVAEKIAEYLRQHAAVLQAAVAGSIRRRAETVKNIDIVVATDDAEAVADIVIAMPGVQRVISRGVMEIRVLLTTGMELAVRSVKPAAYPTALHHYTGSKEHLDRLRAVAGEQGWRIDEHGVTDATGRRQTVTGEEDLYHRLGLAYIPPELREGLDEVRLAAARRLPDLVTTQDIRGVFHVHTVYSDGTATIAEMARSAQARGWQYIGIADHSQSAVYAHGLRVETVRQQRREIERLNAANSDFTILAGIESDILPDGSLDYPDEVLAEFDFVIASVHSAFRLSEAEMTRRIVRAMENPYVTILGHPTGRILLARDGYALDLEEVISAAAGTGTVIEINASPYRLDLDWRWCRRAKEKGVLFSVNPDAHAQDELDYLDYGLAMARKAGLTAADILTSRALPELMPLLGRKRAGRGP
ncbi:DNA polymerase/3'-5' exonuclease PolX [Sporolituus thermophilus]|uniref:DNA-directed DNA polymerase n=1 Tax=Sporolituus thermophilus DSM 23256 TaxID=1123285 RepID=A0A1G7JVU7_9FIRM|nr:DNA polymerase/3'-5' exonuclease PolX [Sporolituus thermophilus]SDF29060.1 DNA polymerase (family 10) [Sporolituus thermophilus DSM 23256]